MKLEFNFWPSWFVIMLSLGSMKPKGNFSATEPDESFDLETLT